MRSALMHDTIAAVATSAGEAGIGLVRLSGDTALSIADKLFLSKDARSPSSYKTHTLHYGWIVDDQRCVIDEVLLSVMRAPRSYTREDVVEINCHGGSVAARRILELVLGRGARMAGPGEFTERAFLNGRIDLTQAEAVIDIIRAQSDYALRVGSSQLKGRLSRELQELRRRIGDVLLQVEASIDFPGEDIEVQGNRALIDSLGRVKRDIDTLIEEGCFGARLRDGVCAVICGRTNVGKSSLLNALLKYERSIVTHLPGTTRDTIEENVLVRGIPVRLIDTAGILKPRNVIDEKALRRTRRSVEQADIIIAVFDGSKSLCAQDRRIIGKLKGRQVIPVINKCDLRQVIEKDYLERVYGRVIAVSAQKGRFINLLEDAIMNLIYLGKTQRPESVIAVNQRHVGLLRSCVDAVEKAGAALRKQVSAEYVSEELKEASACVDRLLGQKWDTDLLDRIFGAFCIGK